MVCGRKGEMPAVRNGGQLGNLAKSWTGVGAERVDRGQQEGQQCLQEQSHTGPHPEPRESHR